MIDLLRRAVVRTFRVIRFILYFIYELVASNVMVSWEIITPRSGISPAIIAMPLRSRNLVEETTFVGIVTFTPGTLSLDLRDSPPTLYIHCMHAPDPERFRRRLQHLEDVVIAALRPVGPRGVDGTAGAEAAVQEGSR